MKVEVITKRRLKSGKWKTYKPRIRVAADSTAALYAEARRRGLNVAERIRGGSTLETPDEADWEIAVRRANSGQCFLRVFFPTLPA